MTLRLAAINGQQVAFDDNGEPQDYDAVVKENVRLHELLERKETQLEATAKEAQRWRNRTRELEGEFSDNAAARPVAKDITAVLLHHRSRFLTPDAAIVPDSAGWRKVEDRLGDRDAASGNQAFNVGLLCESVDGAFLDDWYHEKPHRRRAESIFRDASVVQRNIERRRHHLGHAAHVVRGAGQARRDELLIYMAEDCGCGHKRCEHHDATGGCGHWDGLEKCGCDRFDWRGVGRWREQVA